jgi:hypothetical protein
VPIASSRQRGRTGPLTSSARDLSIRLLGDDPGRLDHTSGVARAAAYAAERLPDVPTDLLVAAAWLHDVGHAASLSRTGFHPLDGALYLEQLGWGDDIVRLVAYHSHSVVSAEEVDALTTLQRFEPITGLIADTLTFADVIAGPDGRGAPVDFLGTSRVARPGMTNVETAELADRRRALLEDSIKSVYAALIPEAAKKRA